MQVRIHIRGVQRLEEEADVVELTAAGELHQMDRGYRIRYQETAASGLEGTETTLEVLPDRLLLTRAGTMNSRLVLEPGNRHEGRYETPYGSLLLGAYTQEVRSELTQQGGRLIFRYTLDMNGSVTGHHEVHMIIEPAGPGNSGPAA